MFYKDKNILVTGGTGLAGSHLIDALLKKGASVVTVQHKKKVKISHDNLRIIEGDLCSSETCLEAVKGIDFIFHCAAVSSGAFDIVNNPAKHITSNLIMCSRLLEVAILAKVKRFLFMSSTTVYPDSKYPMREEDIWTGDVHPSYEAVGWMKRYVEKLCEFYHKHSDMDVCIIRPANFFGPGDDFSLETGHALPALINRVMNDENPLLVWGDGKAIRDFLYVDDVVRGMMYILELFCCGQAINIGSGIPVSIRDSINTMLEVSDKHLAVRYDTSKPSTIPIRRMDVTKAEKVLNFVPSYTFKEGIRLTMDWFMENKERIYD